MDLLYLPFSCALCRLCVYTLQRCTGQLQQLPTAAVLAAAAGEAAVLQAIRYGAMPLGPASQAAAVSSAFGGCMPALMLALRAFQTQVWAACITAWSHDMIQPKVACIA